MKGRDPFARGFAGVLLGFIAFISLTVIGYTLLLQGMPADRLFEAGTFKQQPLTSIALLTLASVAALAAGFLCRMVAAFRKPVIVLAAILGILSVYQMAFVLAIPVAPTPRTGGEDLRATADAMKAEEPKWLSIGVPVLIIAGVLMGGARKTQAR